MRYYASERAHQLRDAIVDMTIRYGGSSMALGFAYADGSHDGKPAEDWKRARRRQFLALQRLSRALRDVEVRR
ncbi:hypothetical protein [Catellatospora sp. NPDC049609]|uniref:hypothetical protein n=1 Tax=Catellatospora sp. NPDC049609 TaxID=3155505 RepID=UPI003437C813